MYSAPFRACTLAGPRPHRIISAQKNNRDSEATVRDAGQSPQIRDCPAKIGTVDTYEYDEWLRGNNARTG